MNNKYWKHYNPVELHDDIGIFERIKDFIPSKKKVLVVTTQGFTKRGITQKILDQLKDHQVVICDYIEPNPELDSLDKTTATFSKDNIDYILAIGGGSVLDAAKIFSLTLSSDISQPLNKIFRENKSQIWLNKLPLIAIPTTSGTGAEVTPFATVWDSKSIKKYSLNSKHIFPDIVLFDPLLTMGLPERETLFSALDAVSHSFESLWNVNRTPISEIYAARALDLALVALPAVLKEPTSIQARIMMQDASLLAGLAISQTRTAIAHAISYPLTIRYGMPHGLACSFTLPAIVEIYYNSFFELFERNSIKVDLLHDIFANFPLSYDIKQYIKLPDAINIIDEMLDPDRANNFIGTVDTDTIENILRKALLNA